MPARPNGPPRRRAIVLAGLACALATLVGACAPAPSLLSDPREILARAVEQLRTARSVHLDVVVDGSLVIGGFLGGPQASASALGLAGTRLQGDLDLAGDRAAVRFEVPALLGLTGELRQVGPDTYLESSLTSRGWHRLSATDLPAGVGRPLAWVDGVIGWLDHPASVPTRLDDAACRAGTCYVVRLAAAASDLRALASAAPGFSPGLDGTTVTVDLRIDRAALQLSEALVHVELVGGSAITVTATFTAWNAGVTVEAPSASEVVPGPLLP